jgi:transcriptional regulator with XRE-family HTH domain
MAETVLEQVLKQRKMSQAELARRAGKSKSWVWRLVHGAGSCRRHEQRLISVALHTPLKRLFHPVTDKPLVAIANESNQ